MAGLTLREAAASLGVAASTLRVQIRNGKLRGKKVGPVWVLTPKEVERYRKESRRMVIQTVLAGPECDGEDCDDYEHRAGCSLFDPDDARQPHADPLAHVAHDSVSAASVAVGVEAEG